MIECEVICGNGLACERRFRAAAGTTRLGLCPKADNFLGFFKPFLLGLFPLAEGSGVSDAAIVLVQVACYMVHVPLVEPLNHGGYELELRGICASRTGHWDEGD